MDYIIDDRLYTPDPGKSGTIYVIAQKRGKNGNIKKSIALRAAVGPHTVELIEKLRLETAGSCSSCNSSSVTISIASESEREVVEREKEFLKIVRKMMK